MKAAKNNGLVPFFWDNGVNAEVINRRTLEPNQKIIDAMYEGASAGVYPF